MNDERKKQLFKYTKPSGALPVVCIILAVLCFLFTLLFFAAATDFDADTNILIGTFAVATIIFVLMTVFYYRLIGQLKNKINDIDANGELLILLNDFEKGGKAFNDKLRLGQKYLIGKKTRTIVSYNEIARIYQYIHSTNCVEDTRSLQIVLHNNKKLDLCKLPLWGKADEEVANVFNYVKSMNPNIAIGYRD